MTSVFGIFLLGLVTYMNVIKPMDADINTLEQQARPRFHNNMANRNIYGLNPDFRNHENNLELEIKQHFEEPDQRIREIISSDETEKAVEAVTEIMEEYQHVVVPRALVRTSQVLQRGMNCTDLVVPLHANTIGPAMLLRPAWIEKSPSVGNCPTEYSVKRLGAHFSPSALLEAKCTCETSACSREGHQCESVKKQFPVWRKGLSGLPPQIVLQEVIVACACMLRPGLMADFISSPWLTT